MGGCPEYPACLSLAPSHVSIIGSAEFSVQVQSCLAQVLLVVKRCLMSTSPSIHSSLLIATFPCLHAKKKKKAESVFVVYYPLPHCKVTKQNKKRKIYKRECVLQTHKHTHNTHTHTTTNCQRKARMISSHRCKGLTAAFLGMFLASCIRTLIVSRGWQIRASMKPAVPPAIKLVRGDFFSLAAIVVYYLLELLVSC